MMPDLTIRPLTFADVPRLSEIDAEFESDRFLDVEKTTQRDTGHRGGSSSGHWFRRSAAQIMA